MNNGIIILYSGKKPTASVISALHDVLTQTGTAYPETVSVSHYEKSDIENALLVKECQCKIVFDKEEHPEAVDVLEQSCIYIAERFKDYISKGRSGDVSGSYVNFMFALRDALAEARNSCPKDDDDHALIEAVEQIGMNFHRIDKNMIKRTKLTTVAINIVYAIYQKMLYVLASELQNREDC